MQLRIQHETRLTYTNPVSETVFEVRMAPITDEDQTSLSYRLKTDPPAPVTSYRDGYSNRVDLFNLSVPYKELVILATSFVRTHRRPAADRIARSLWPGEDAAADTVEYLEPSPLVDDSPALKAFLEKLPAPGSVSFEGTIQTLLAAVRDRLRYEKKVTSAKTRLSEALELGKGVCQDFSHLFIGACRGLGIPARYVSGYVHHPGELATHAWCQVWGGGVGWIDLDPTRGALPGDDYIIVAVGRDYTDTPPNRGVWTGRAEETITVSVKVEAVERLPMEWMDWGQPSRRVPAHVVGGGQSQRLGGMSQSQRLSPPIYPQQRRRGGGEYRQQQGQQQQSPGRPSPLR